MNFDVLTINTSVEIFGIIICMIVILCRGFVTVNQHKKTQTDFTLLVLCEALILFFGAVTGLMTGQNAQAAYLLLPVCCFMKYVFKYLLPCFFTNYVTDSFPSDKNRYIHIFVRGLTALSIAALILNLKYNMFYFIDSSNVCQRGKLYTFSLISNLIIYSINLVNIIIQKKKVSKRIFRSFMAYMIIPLCAFIIQLFLYGIDIVDISMIVILMIMFVIMQNQFVSEYIEQKHQLQESSFKLMVSQIKPHFIFNSLTAIAQLCDDDPSLAKTTTVSFAKYLRGNLSALDKTEAIPFEDELNHIKSYLDIECVRFGNYLNVIYDIEATDFKVPGLSIQPLVENAVKHGVGMKEDGGTVRISTRKKENNIEIKITDDGIGFDTSKPYTNEGHVGITSSVERLRQLCDAETIIESTVGKGTEITVLIPIK